MYVSEAEERAIISNKNKLDRIKEEGERLAKTGMELGAGLAVGALYGAINAKKGGTSSAPFLVAGKAPLDTLIAGAGVIAAVLMKPNHKARYAVMGAAAGGLALYGSRMGAAWETARLQGGAQPAASSATSQGYSVGHGMRSRHFGPAGNRHRAAASFVHAYAGR